MTLVHISILLTLLYAAALFVIGLISSRGDNSTTKQYFVANGDVGWIAFALTLFATWMSTFAFLGSPGFYYLNGVKWLMPHGFLVVASPLLFWILGRRIWTIGRREGHLTPGDFFASRFRSQTMRYLVAVTCLTALVPYCLIQLVGIGKVVEASTEGLVSYQAAVSFTSFCILFYAYLGGIRAVILTDAIQAFLFGAILFGGAFALYNSFAHPAELAQSIRDLDDGVTTFDPSRIGAPLTLLAMWGFGYVLTPHMWQRIYMTNSARNLGRGVVAGSVLALIVVAIPSLFIGLAARSSGLEVTDTDKLMVAVFSQHADWMLPLLMLGAVAAGMSTVDSQLLTASSIVVHDLGGAKAAARSSARGRLTVFVGVVLLWALSLSSLREGAIVLLASKGIGIALLLLVPLLGGLASARPSTAAGVGSLIAGGAVLAALELGAIKAQIPLGFGFPVAAVTVQVMVYLSLHWITATAKGGRRSARVA